MPFTACKCVYWLMMSPVFLCMCHNPPKKGIFCLFDILGSHPRRALRLVLGLRVSEWKGNQRGEHAPEHLQSSVSCAW